MVVNDCFSRTRPQDSDYPTARQEAINCCLEHGQQQLDNQSRGRAQNDQADPERGQEQYHLPHQSLPSTGLATESAKSENDDYQSEQRFILQLDGFSIALAELILALDNN